MESAMQRSGNSRWNYPMTVMALAMIAVVGGGSMAPAWAMNDEHRGHAIAHRGHGRSPHVVYAAPSYVYAPPPVYYAPPPGPPVISFVFPLRFR